MDQAAKENWLRFEYVRQRGHTEYMRRAKMCEGMYMGGGRQWSLEDRQALEAAGRPAQEFNQILPKVNSALGYQIANRMDISYRPRGGDADREIASTMSKLAMHIADQNQLHWKETQVFSDGLIQQRGYFELTVCYQDSMLGEIKVDVLDPLDVIPDPDAKTYDPDGWGDVIVTRWMTLDEIEALYGKAKRSEVEEFRPDDPDFGEDMGDEGRNRFGDSYSGNATGHYTDQEGIVRVRVVDRQVWRMTNADAIITPTGDIRAADNIPPARLQSMLAAGSILQKRRMRRVRWIVSTEHVVLHDDWSPFSHFTIVPFFPVFRRGLTIGMVDNAVGPQQMLNKTLSQVLHVVNTTANSGWITWANTMTNMSEDELEERGAETGLHIVLRKDTPIEQMPRKIQPNQVPTGLDRIVDRSMLAIEQATGINDAMQGQQGREVSGIAIQSRQHAAQQQLAVPLDNLSRTRHMMAIRMLDMIQSHYDQPRIVRIVETDNTGRETTQEVGLNMPADDGSVLNDVTAGEYDVVIAEVPMQVTFENSQFLQAIELLDKGAPIPWEFVLRYSNLANKQEVIDAIAAQSQQKIDPLVQAKVELAKAQTRKTLNEAVNKSVESQYSAMQAAGVIAATPATAPLADGLLRSAGYVDQDAAPIVPEYTEYSAQADYAPPAPTTNPITPANPAAGMNAGIETQGIE
jgi:hypothetical protein